MKPLKILFVDDEPDVEVLMKQRYRRELRENKFTFFFAQSGIDALKILASEPEIYMVVSDINMPEMDGLTLLDNINKTHPSVIPIIVSAYGDMNNIRAAMNLGAFDFVTKPINFEDLTVTIEKTACHIQNLLDSKSTKNRLEGILYELNVAAHIQKSIIPTVFINNDKLALFGKMTPAKEIGGDFFDFFLLDDTHLAFVMADVSGKGVPAALFMTVTRTLIRSYAQINRTASEIITRVNNALEKDNSNMMFVTTFFGVLDITTGVVKYVNGGHNPPYIIRLNGQVEAIPPTGDMALGVIALDNCTEAEATLTPKDALFLYTDGVTEAANSNNEYYTDQRLLDTLKENKDLEVGELVNTVGVDVLRFANGCPQSDDITMLAIRYLGGQKN